MSEYIKESTEEPNYYKDLWSKKGKKGRDFFDYVNFDTPVYRIQELAFRKILRKFDDESGLPSFRILELGPGTGRMTSIVFEELKLLSPENRLERYDCIDIHEQMQKAYDYLGHRAFSKINWYYQDITDTFDLAVLKNAEAGTEPYHLIIASEVFMHIKPEHIYPLFAKLTKIGMAMINIDWFIPQLPIDDERRNRIHSDWCYIHHYPALYDANGMTKNQIHILASPIDQAIFYYTKSEY